jgi:hypothetical protein
MAGVKVEAAQFDMPGKKTCTRCHDTEWPCFLVDGLCRMCQARRRDERRESSMTQATPYRFCSIEADGPWTSPPFPAAARRHIMQEVIGGFIMGRPRWTEDLDGNFIYGLDAKGKELKFAPTYTPEPTPRRRGKNKPATAEQLKSERSRARKEQLDAALATTLETRQADPYNIASWESEAKPTVTIEALTKDHS